MKINWARRRARHVARSVHIEGAPRRRVMSGSIYDAVDDATRPVGYEGWTEGQVATTHDGKPAYYDLATDTMYVKTGRVEGVFWDGKE